MGVPSRRTGLVPPAAAAADLSLPRRRRRMSSSPDLAADGHAANERPTDA